MARPCIPRLRALNTDSPKRSRARWLKVGTKSADEIMGEIKKWRRWSSTGAQLYPCSAGLRERIQWGTWTRIWMVEGVLWDLTTQMSFKCAKANGTIVEQVSAMHG